MIKKPMLAGKCEYTSTLKFPVFVTPKLDGIRCLTVGDRVLSRKFLPIPNHHIRSVLKGIPCVLDGELMLENSTFSEITSSVMSEDGKPDFVYYIFDHVKEDDVLNVRKPYLRRMVDLAELDLDKYPHKLVIPEEVKDESSLQAVEEKYISQGYEGVMIRSPYGPYKQGRSTENEGYLLKLKRFEDDEAVVIGFEELLRNKNTAEKDAFGRTKRSQAKDGLHAAGTLGALIVEHPTFGQFSIGTGFDSQQRKDIWKYRDTFTGKLIKFKYQKAGMKDKPRFPVWLGFRNLRDT